MNIEITTTVESIEQAKQLLEKGIDTLYFGEETYGLRLPTSFSRTEQQELVELAHSYGKKATIAVNGIMHPEKMATISEYLDFLAQIKVDAITVGDPGVIYLLNKGDYPYSFIYDGHTLVTNARQVNFWAKKGAVGAVIAREVPYEELKAMSSHLDVWGEILVYGATCIHQSKRPLVRNFFSFIQAEESVGKERDLFISEPKKPETHYSIYEDTHGTHIFADNDLNLMGQLDKLVESQFTHWKLDGLYTPGDNFVAIADCFIQARQLIGEGKWTTEQMNQLNEQIEAIHPKGRGLDTGFFLMDPDEVK